MDDALVEVVAQALHGDLPTPWIDSSPRWRTVLRSNARTVIAAMQPALTVACEAGRREGLEQAAIAAGRAAWRHEGHDGYSKAMDGAAVQQVQSCVAAIRALIPALPTEATP